jgi:hypothetical protein
MNKEPDKWLHAVLDGEIDPHVGTSGEVARVARYRDVLGRLEKQRVRAPAGLSDAIMASLPRSRRLTVLEWLQGLVPERRQWGVPALSGALAMLALMLAGWLLMPAPDAHRVRMCFQLHAPGAQRVELVGDFTKWTSGAIQLRGPDASGHWTAEIALPEGRYEYQFLVDGKVWMTDPNAVTHRPDGFGRENAVLDVYDERG